MSLRRSLCGQLIFWPRNGTTLILGLTLEVKHLLLPSPIGSLNRHQSSSYRGIHQWGIRHRASTIGASAIGASAIGASAIGAYSIGHLPWGHPPSGQPSSGPSGLQAQDDVSCATLGWLHLVGNNFGSRMAIPWAFLGGDSTGHYYSC